MAELTTLMQQKLPKGGVYLAEQKPHMEVIDEVTGNVWMSVEAVSQEQFDAFELAENWRKLGRGAGAMDQALFRHSPNASDQPVREQLIIGLRFINVAQPKFQTSGQTDSGLLEIMVNKAHVIGFAADRQLSVLHLNGRHYVEVVGDNQNDSELPLPDDASIQLVTLSEPWVVDLPTPTQTFWVFQPALRSFQGPVDLTGRMGLSDNELC